MATWTGGSSSSRFALDQLQRLDRDDRAARRASAASFFASAGADIRARRRPSVPTIVIDSGVSSSEHAPEGVPGALDVGGEDRPADQLAEVGRGDLVVAGRGEVGHLGVEARVLARQRELRPEAADDQLVPLDLDGQLGVGAGAEDRPEPRGRAG